MILIVEECGDDYVMCKVVNDCKLGEKKNVNVPGRCASQRCLI